MTTPTQVPQRPAGPRALARLRPSQVVAGAAALLLVASWIGTGSFVLALLLVLLVAGALGLGALVLSRVARGPRTHPDAVPDALPTIDLSLAPGPGDRVRRVLRGLLARPWVRGDGLVRAATARLASEDALVWTPRGQRVAAPHLWVEWHPADLAEIADRWPLDVLASELVDSYAERARAEGVRWLTGATRLHLLASTDVPVGRVVVTAAFSTPQKTPAAVASSDDPCAPAPGAQGGPPGAAAGPSSRSGASSRSGPGPRHPASVALATGRGPRGGTPTALTVVGGSAPHRAPASARPASARGPAGGSDSATTDAPTRTPDRRPGGAGRGGSAPLPRSPEPAPATLVSETPGVPDVPLTGAGVRLGRDPRRGVVVDRSGVSWHHLTITRHDAVTWLVTDDGSTQGTFVGTDRIAGPTAVGAGDVVGLGHDGPRYRVQQRPDGPGPGEAWGTRWYERTRQEVA